MAFFGNKVSIRLYFLSDFCVASPYCHCFRKHSIVPLECCRFLFLHILSSVASRASRATATVFDHTVLIDFVERHICAQFHTCTWKLIAWVARIPFCVQTLYLRIILIYPVAFYSMGWCAKLCGWMSVFFSMSSYFFLFSDFDLISVHLLLYIFVLHVCLQFCFCCVFCCCCCYSSFCSSQCCLQHSIMSTGISFSWWYCAGNYFVKNARLCTENFFDELIANIYWDGKLLDSQKNFV